jgi:rRNA biogenesis protein RRP5
MRIQASIRQALPNYQSPATAVTNIDIGAVVSGVVTEVHKNNIILALRDTGARALISVKGLAKHRKTLSPQPPESVQVGDAIEDLVVVTRNLEKGFVIATLPPKAKPAALARSGLSLDTLTIGQLVGGRVIRHTRHGAFIKLSAHLGGILHSTDTTDDYDFGTPYPSADSVLKAVVIGIDKERRSVALSMRPSRMFPLQEKPVKDREIKSLDDLKEGDTVRGFIKTVVEHGLFVSLGRDIDARVQIKELFDEAWFILIPERSDPDGIFVVCQGLEASVPCESTRKRSHTQVIWFPQLRSSFVHPAHLLVQHRH